MHPLPGHAALSRLHQAVLRLISQASAMQQELQWDPHSHWQFRPPKSRTELDPLVRLLSEGIARIRPISQLVEGHVYLPGTPWAQGASALGNGIETVSGGLH